MMAALTQLARELRTRVDGMIVRGVVELVNDKLKSQRLQLTLLADQVVDDVEHLQPYGISFVAPAGSQALALAVGGARAHTVAICVDHPGERPRDAKPREGGLYTRGEWRLFVNDKGELCVGAKESDEHMLLGNYFAKLFEEHTHMTAMGPSDPPSNRLYVRQALSRHTIGK